VDVNSLFSGNSNLSQPVAIADQARRLTYAGADEYMKLSCGLLLIFRHDVVCLPRYIYAGGNVRKFVFPTLRHRGYRIHLRHVSILLF
jgi:hypothetical protein